MQSSQKLRLSGGESVWFPKLRRRVTYNREIKATFDQDPALMENGGARYLAQALANTESAGSRRKWTPGLPQRSRRVIRRWNSTVEKGGHPAAPASFRPRCLLAATQNPQTVATAAPGFSAARFRLEVRSLQGVV